MQCRYAGATLDFYSVAEHCILGCDEIALLETCEGWEITPERILAYLMHDAPEAYITDLPSPIKQYHPSFKKIEDHLQAIIWERFGLPEDADMDFIKWLDLKMLAMEKQKVYLHDLDWGWELPKAAQVSPMYLSPEAAKQMFLKRFKELTNG